MTKETGMRRAIAAITALGAVGAMIMSTVPADAVVYCRAVGVPKGCVARPGAAAVTHRPVVYCKRVGVPKGCVMR